MNKNIRNVFYATAANIVGMAVSMISTVIIPRFISDTSYGYWQLYIFYTSYIGFFHLGLQDGIYLRYGGAEYDRLDKKLLHSQWLLLILFELLVGGVLATVSSFAMQEIDRIEIVRMFAICCVIYLPSALLQYILLMTNRISKYAAVITLEKGIFGLEMIVLLVLKVQTYRWFIYADLMGRAVALCYCIYLCKDIVTAGMLPFHETMREAICNCKVGVILLLANIASLLLIGIVRLFIERGWSIEVFGRISLSIALCNFGLTFLTAVGQVLFPMLKRTEESKLPEVYRQMSRVLGIVVLLALAGYYPLAVVVNRWIPNYADSIRYLEILLPLCVFESKMNLLINTYYKVLRKEKLLLLLNLPPLLLSLGLSFYAVNVKHNMELALLTIVIASAFRCVLTDFYLAKTLQIKNRRDSGIEIFLSSMFIVLNVLQNSGAAWIEYICAYAAIVVLFYKDDVARGFKYLKQHKKA